MRRVDVDVGAKGAEPARSGNDGGWRAETIREVAKVARVRGEWQALAELLGRPCVTPAWIMGFWRHVHVESPLRIVLVRDGGGKLMGVAPFYVERDRAFVTRYRLISDGVGARVEPLARPQDRPDVASVIAQQLRTADPRPNIVTLDSSDAGSGWGSLLQQEWAGPRRPRLLRHHPDVAPVVSVAGSDEAWLAGRSPHFRKRIRQLRSRLDALGAEFRRSSTVEGVADDLRVVFRLHDERCHDAGRTSAIDQRTRRAICEACVSLYSAGGVELWLAARGREVAGAQLYLRAGSRMLLLTGGLSSSWSRESVGLALIDRAIRRAREIGVRTVDLGYGDVPYKWRFADCDAPVAREILYERDWSYPFSCVSSDEMRRAAARRAVERMPVRIQDMIRAARRMT